MHLIPTLTLTTWEGDNVPVYPFTLAPNHMCKQSSCLTNGGYNFGKSLLTHVHPSFVFVDEMIPGVHLRTVIHR